MWKSRLSFLAACWLPTIAFAQVTVHDDSFIPDHILRVTYDTNVGCQSRKSVLVNGSLPGPAVHIPAGSQSWIRVYNDIPDQNLTMHWHGLSQAMAPFADGSPQASQWPIPPGYFFDYEILPNCDDSGTYFYHSHVGLQALTASGPLIIDDPTSSPIYLYDEERIFHLQDYFSLTDGEMMGRITASRWTGETHGILLNGKSITQGVKASAATPRTDGDMTRSHPRRRHTTRTYTTDTDDDCDLPVIDVKPGKTYRFRFIGATGISLLTLGIEGHNDLRIVQVDGSEYNVPVTTRHLQIASGQRFDVMFTAKTAKELAADGNKATYFVQFETRGLPSTYIGYAVLRYRPEYGVPDAPSQPVLSLPNQISDWMEYTFTPLFPDRRRAPTSAEVTRRVIIDCDLVQDAKSGQVVWKLAHQAWTENAVQTPALVDIYKYGQGAIPDYDAAMENYGWDPATKSFPAKIGEVLEIVLQNRGALLNHSGLVDSHPFHSHGKHVFDIGSGPGKYDAAANNAKLERFGYRPITRDTTMLYRYEDKVNPGEPAGWRAWRVRADTPGVWMMHCHLLAHMMMGMQTVWVVGNAADIVQFPPTVSADYFTYRGNVMGNDTNPPKVYEAFNSGIEGGCEPGDAAK
ncbi:laccase-like protein [Podospora conica]|nr:laccase-like protein [Schizothecium conicum]